MAAGVGVGIAILGLSVLGEGDPPGKVPVAVGSLPSELLEPDVFPIESPSHTDAPSATPSDFTPPPTPTLTRSPTSAPTPSATPAPTPTKSPEAPQPVLLGPSSRGELYNMVERYCDRYLAGSDPDPRSDGRWACERLLSSRIVNMDVACADAYGSGAYARHIGGDAYGWRCYRAP